MMDQVEALRFGDEVLDHLPHFFAQFVRLSASFDFRFVLHPLWMALEGVLDDRLALASVSLERLASCWEHCAPHISDLAATARKPLWKRKGMLRSLRKTLCDRVSIVLSGKRDRIKCEQRVLGTIARRLASFLKSDPCKGLTCEERRELQEVLRIRINNLTQPPIRHACDGRLMIYP